MDRRSWTGRVQGLGDGRKRPAARVQLTDTGTKFGVAQGAQVTHFVIWESDLLSRHVLIVSSAPRKILYTCTLRFGFGSEKCRRSSGGGICTMFLYISEKGLWRERR